MTDFKASVTKKWSFPTEIIHMGSEKSSLLYKQFEKLLLYSIELKKKIKQTMFAHY
jgi:hypothetical protein